MDIVTMGELVVEIMREKPGDQLFETSTFLGPFPSGAPGIFIDTAARLGVKSAIISGVGNDDFGVNILTRLEKDGVDCSHVIKSDKSATGVAFVTYFDDGSRKFIFHMDQTPAVMAKAPEKDVFKDVKFFHIMGCSLLSNENFAKEIIKTMKMMKENGAKISFDPNIRLELFKNPNSKELINEVFNLTNVFLPGVEELLQITGCETIDEAIASCFEATSMEIVALKNGSKGCTVYTREGSTKYPAFSIVQKDATGAGDCFDAGFLTGLIQSCDIEIAAKTAAACGALNAMAFGPMEGNISPKTVKEMCS